MHASYSNVYCFRQALFTVFGHYFKQHFDKNFFSEIEAITTTSLITNNICVNSNKYPMLTLHCKCCITKVRVFPMLVISNVNSFLLNYYK